jgi:GGDEF domain-containing protein
VRRRSAHVWEISATTKDHIADGARTQTQHNVVVFHIIDFHRQQAEMGPHASRRLTRRVAELIKEALGPTAFITIQQGGTIIALLPGDRDAAEETVCELLRGFGAAPETLKQHGRAPKIALACGMIAFPQAGPPLARSIPIPMIEAGSTASVAS